MKVEVVPPEPTLSDEQHEIEELKEKVRHLEACTASCPTDFKRLKWIENDRF